MASISYWSQGVWMNVWYFVVQHFLLTSTTPNALPLEIWMEALIVCWLHFHSIKKIYTVCVVTSPSQPSTHQFVIIGCYILYIAWLLYINSLNGVYMLTRPIPFLISVLTNKSRDWRQVEYKFWNIPVSHLECLTPPKW